MPEIIVKLGANIVQKYFFVKEALSVGRAPENEIVIENLAVSRKHAVVEFDGEKYLIGDQGSSNGTFVNGVKVKKTDLVDKDVITIGKHKLYFYDQRPADQLKAHPSLSEGTMVVEQKRYAELIVSKGRQKGQTFMVPEGTTQIGRGSENDIRLTDWFVSKKHALIEWHQPEFVIRDEGSWRHTTVNGEAVEEASLRDGDIIQLGPTVQLTFRLHETLQEVRPGVRQPVEMPERWQEESAAVGSVEEELALLDQAMPEGQRITFLNPVSVELPVDKQAETVEDDEPTPTPEVTADSIDNGSSGQDSEHECVAPTQFDEEEPVEVHPGEAEYLRQELNEQREIAFAAAELKEAVEQRRSFSDDQADEPNDDDHDSESVAETPAEPTAVFPPAEPPSPTETLDESGWDELDLDRVGEAPILPDPAESSAQLVTELGRAYLETVEVDLPDRTDECALKVEPTPDTTPPSIDVAEAATEKQLVQESATGGGETSSEESDDEVLMWERALTNKSLAIRKQAARQLRKLTGRDYEY